MADEKGVFESSQTTLYLELNAAIRERRIEGFEGFAEHLEQSKKSMLAAIKLRRRVLLGKGMDEKFMAERVVAGGILKELKLKEIEKNK